MDAREAPLGVEGGSCTPDPVSEPAEPVESILLWTCMSSLMYQRIFPICCEPKLL